ncbi:hypothetical protein MYFR107205_27225 [Mycolicibacterium frederiksbergense]
MGDAASDGVGELDVDPTETLLLGQRSQGVRCAPHPGGPVRRARRHTQGGEQIGPGAQVFAGRDPGPLSGRDRLGDNMIQQVAGGDRGCQHRE